MRPRRRGWAWWGLFAAAGCVLVTGLAVVVAVTGDGSVHRATTAVGWAPPAARTAGTSAEAAREPASAEQPAERTRSTTPDSPAAPSSSSPSSSSSSSSSSWPSRPSRSAPAPPAASSPVADRVVTFVGDSWTAADGSESGRGYAAPAAERAGWTSHVLGINGTGYLRGAPDQTFAQRITPAAATDADVVIVQGSLNEQWSELSALEPAARRTLADLQAAMGPDTLILVIGASYTPGTDPATIEAINDAIGRAAATVGVRFVDPAAENWNDPADPTIWADPDHPNDAGYRLIADHVSALLEDTAHG